MGHFEQLLENELKSPPKIWDSWLEPDKSIVIRLTNKPVRHIRIMPWPSLERGSVHRIIPKGKSPEIDWDWQDNELNINLFAIEQSVRANDSLDLFTSRIPEKYRALAKSYSYAQIELLNLAYNHPGTLDLLPQDHNLLWLLASANKKRAFTAETIEELIKRKRHELLSELIQHHASRKNLKLLRRIHFQDASYDDLKAVVHLLRNDTTQGYFLHHWARITPDAIRVVYRNQSIAFAKCLGKLLDSVDMDEWRKEITDLDNTWTSLVRIANVHEDRSRQRALERCTTYQDMVSLEVRWTLEDNVHTPRENRRATWKDLKKRGLVDRPFPSLDGYLGDDDCIHRIMTVRELANETISMRHCVYDSFNQALSGVCAYFKAFTPCGERLTIELRLQDKNTYILNQIKGHMNADPSVESLEYLHTWFHTKLKGIQIDSTIPGYS